MTADQPTTPAPAPGPGTSPDFLASVGNCDREPIHVPGLIQPHGALVAFDLASGLVLHASTNLARWLPGGRSLEELLGAGAAECRGQAVAAGVDGAVRHRIVELPARPGAGQPADLVVAIHVHQDIGIAEFEPASALEEEDDWVQTFSDTLDALRDADDLEDLVECIARQVARLTRFDRVMVYRFGDDWHGHVIADLHEHGMESFFDLHFPASDIPAQARELFLTNPVRYIAEVDSEPVPVVRSASAVPAQLDMSHANLRSASPIHLHYLHNMGVASTLTISLLVEGRLWGLIACHHRTPTALPMRLRSACFALALSASFMVGWNEQRQRTAAAAAALRAQSQLVEAFNELQTPLADVIEHSSAALQRVVGATGGALWRGDAVFGFGQWPDAGTGEAILGHVQQAFAVSRDDVWCTDEARLQPVPGAAELRTVCGLLSIKLNATASSGIVWLRPEFRREVAWGGDPDKPMQLGLDANGQPTLSPRSSFARWQTSVKGRCQPWTDQDRAGAGTLLTLGPALLLRDAVAQLSLSDNRFRSFVALQSDAYWQVDPVGRLVALSWRLPTGESAAEGQTLAEFLAPWCAEREIEALKRVLASRKPFRALHVRGRGEAERAFEVVLNGEPIRDQYGRTAGWHGTITDVTRELAQQEELRRREVEQQAMLDNELIAILKFRDRRVVWKNRAVDRIFGLAPDEFYGQSGRRLFADETAFENFIDASSRELNAGGSYRAQIEMVRKEGAGVWIDIHGMLLSAQPRESMWLLADITPLRQAEAARIEELQLDAENRQIREASRLKDLFLANMSHELRTPLNAVIGLTEMLHSGEVAPESAEYGRYLGVIGESGQQLLKLIDEVLDFAAVEAGKFEFRPETVRLESLVGKVVELMAGASSRKQIEITTAIDPSLGEIIVDPLRLKQAVSCYLSNAIKFTPQRGTVMVRALAEGPSRFRLEVQDSGIGIAARDLPRLFTSFQQLSEGSTKKYEGTGLGLALLRRLVEAQGGTVGVRSTPGSGSVFHLVLPRADLRLAKRAPAPIADP